MARRRRLLEGVLKRLQLIGGEAAAIVLRFHRAPPSVGRALEGSSPPATELFPSVARCTRARAARISARPSGSAQPHAPAADERLTGFEADDALAAGERVRRAAHRLAAQTAPPPLGGERVGRVDLDQREGLVNPQLHRPPIGPDQPRPRATLAVSLEIGEGEVDLLSAEAPRRGEVVGGPGDGLAAGWQLAIGVGEDPRCRPQLERAVVDQPRAGRQVGMLAGAERTAALADVHRADRRRQAIVVQRVLDAHVERPRPASQRVEADLHAHPRALLLGNAPVAPAQKPWMALRFSGSVSATWYCSPSKL